MVERTQSSAQKQAGALRRDRPGVLVTIGLASSLAFALAPGVAQAAAHYDWRGGGSDADLWSANDNWQLGGGASGTFPDAGDTADVTDGGEHQPMDVQQDIAAGRLFVHGGSGPVTIGHEGNPADAELTLSQGNALSVRWQNPRDLTFNVDVALAQSTLWEFNGGAPVATMNGAFNLAGNNLTIRKDTHSNLQSIFNAPIRGSGGITFTADNDHWYHRAVMSADNTYTGQTTIGTDSALLLDGGSLANSNIVLNDAGEGGPAPSLSASLQGADENPGTLHYNIAGDNADLIQVNADGELAISNLNLDFDVTGDQGQSAYIIADYGSGALSGAQFNNVIDKPAGYRIDYQYNNGTQIAAVVPTPGTLASCLVVISFGTLATRRSRRA